MKLSLVVPCYNEEGNIRAFYTEAKRVFDAEDYEYEIVFVNDGSKDKTQEELENQELEQLEQARQKEITQREEVQRQEIQKENRRKEIEEKNKNIAGRSREETEVDSGKNCKVIAIHNKTEDAAVAEREAKMQQFEDIMGRIVGKALREQAENLGDAMGNHLCNKMLREVDELMVEQEQREEERYKRLDETIRSVQKARQEVAVSKDGTRKKSLFFRKNKRKL